MMIVLRKTHREQQEAALDGPSPPNPVADRNEVALSGRLSAPPVQRILRTGRALTTFRLIVRRGVDQPAGEHSDGPHEAPGVKRQSVDVVECAVWDSELLRSLAAVAPGDRLAVHGALRRRFARSPAAGAPTSWFNIEVTGIDPLA